METAGDGWSNGFWPHSLPIVAVGLYPAASAIVFTTLDRLPGTKLIAESEPEPQLLRDTQAYLAFLRASSRLAPGHAPIRAEDAARLQDAWRTFYARHNPLIRRLVRRYRMVQADSDDCVQEVWTHLLRKLGAFDPDPRRGSFAAWLIALVEHRAIDFLRKRKRAEMPLAKPNLPLISREPDPAAQYERTRQVQVLRRYLTLLRGQVPAESYRVFHLHWVEDQCPADIAQRLGFDPNQVRAQIRRVGRVLRDLLQGDLQEGLAGTGVWET